MTNQRSVKIFWRFVGFINFFVHFLIFFLFLCLSLSNLYRNNVGGSSSYEINIEGSKSVAAKFGQNEYKCEGICFCEEDYDLDRRSGLVGRGIRSFSLLFVGVSSIIAYKRSRDQLESHCEKILTDSCSIGYIQSEIKDCRIVDEAEELYSNYAGGGILHVTNEKEGVRSAVRSRELDSTDEGNGKTYAVTGATGVIGFEIARLIALENLSNTVYILARDPVKAGLTVQKLIERTGNPNIFFEIADLSLKLSVKNLRLRWGDRNLDVLVNNHVTCPLERIESEDGIEMNMACNILGYFWLIEEFEGLLHQSSSQTENSRIVNVVSYWAGGLDLDDLEFKKRDYNNVDAYFQCKQAGRMLTQYYAKHFAETNVDIDINSSMSGDVDSQCSQDLDCPVPGDPTEAARTPFEVAIGKLGRGESGEYFRDRRKARKEAYEDDIESIEKLYEKCREY